MNMRPINADDAPEPTGYAQAMDVTGANRLLFVSGQIPVTREGAVPSTFDEQARLAWANVMAQLAAAGLSLSNLVKVTIFLSSREFALANREIRQSVLGQHTPALTVIITGIFDEQWLLEIEGIAAA
jgi:2-iminobutanoate/2-iminopropanoate deaminase